MHTISALCSSKVQWKSSSVAFIWVVSLQMQNKHLQFINYVNNECVDQPTINSFFFYWYTFYNYPVYIITNSTWSIKDDEDIISFIMFLSHPFSLFSWSSFVFLSPSNSALDFLQHDGNWLVVIYMLWLLCSWGKSSCCLYVCMYMYIYIYIMCVCVCVCKYVCVCEFMYVYLFVCMCVCVCIYIYVCMYVCIIYVCVFARVRPFIWGTCPVLLIPWDRNSVAWCNPTDWFWSYMACMSHCVTKTTTQSLSSCLYFLIRYGY